MKPSKVQSVLEPAERTRPGQHIFQPKPDAVALQRRHEIGHVFDDDVREAWFLFKRQRLLDRAREWIEDVGIEEVTLVHSRCDDRLLGTEGRVGMEEESSVSENSIDR